MGHSCAVSLVEPAGHAYPALQMPLHVAVAQAEWLPYRPAVQFKHCAAAFDEYVPGGHATAVALVEPAGHAYPAVQYEVHAGPVPPPRPYHPA